MANFKGHFIGASVASGIVASGLLSLKYVDSSTAMIGFLFGVIGGLAPDLDSENSTPLKIAFGVFSIFGAFFILFSKGLGYSIAEMFIIWIATYLFIRQVIFGLFKKLTVHRGMFHSIPSAILSGLLVTNMMYYFFHYNAFLSWIFGFFMTFGYIIHLLLDEFVSVNLFGAHIKKSFGTALKFYDKNNLISTLAIYMAVGFVFYYAPDFNKALSLFSNKDLYTDFLNILLPKNGWFNNLF